MARIGLLSDSHGRASTTRAAVDLLLGQGVDRLIHLGDIVSVEVIDALVVGDPAGGTSGGTSGGGRLPVHLVFGNVDWDVDGLGRYARSLDLSVDHPVGRLDADGKTVGFLHGHDGRAMAQLLAEGVDYLCHGHSHTVIDRMQGGTRVVNPGALFRARSYTVAVLDTAADTVSVHELSAVAR